MQSSSAVCEQITSEADELLIDAGGKASSAAPCYASYQHLWNPHKLPAALSRRSGHRRGPTLRPRRRSSLWTLTEEAQELRPPSRARRSDSSATMSAVSVCIGCASGVAYTRVSGAFTSCPMFLHGRSAVISEQPGVGTETKDSTAQHHSGGHPAGGSTALSCFMYTSHGGLEAYLTCPTMCAFAF